MKTREFAGRPIIVRPGPEIALKCARVRQRFSAAMRRNVAEALWRRRIPHQISVRYARLFVETDDADAALAVLTNVFGVGSLSPVLATTGASLEEIERVGDRAIDFVRGRTFAVRTKRVGEHSFSSSDVNCRLGALLVPFGSVNLDHPDVTVGVEVLGDTAYLFAERVPGAMGLPSGVQGKALALLSGGFDSAVAAWRIMRRGVSVDYVFFNLGGNAYEKLVLQVAKLLTSTWAHGQRPNLHVVEFNAVTDALKSSVRQAYWQVVLKRLMYRAAARIAGEIEASALVTGDSLGQVSSQTVHNLNAIDAVVDLSVLRPLVGHDKTEIMREAEHIGTAPLSKRIKEYCGLARQPIIAGRRERVDEQESKFDLGILWQAVESRKIIDITGVSATDLKLPYSITREIPSNAVLIDCRPESSYRQWHVPRAEHHDAASLLENLGRLSKDRTYVLYCTYGTQTPHLAELMQQAGFEAYAFEGGISRLRELSGEDDL